MLAKFKRPLFFIFLLCSLPCILAAQSLGYKNNRIAISADGNNQADEQHFWPRADPDDWGATPASLAILAKLNLQDKLVHYSYNNFIDAPPHTSETNHMKLGVNGGIKYWNFDADRFFDVSAQYDAALTHLVNELKRSSSDDPLYFIHMGPAEFFYRAVKRLVDEGKVEALNHVYIISHSGYNDNHLRRGDPKFDKTPVAEADKHHRMQEAISLSGNRLHYKKIKDQNSGENPHKGWKSHTDWTVWYWMRDHQDPSVAWIYERMLANQKNSADISDAGMLYYLLLGDENGSPSKFKQFIGKGINPAAEASKLHKDIRWVGIKDFEIEKIGNFVAPYKDKGRNAIAINAGLHKNKYAAVKKVFEGASGNYNITLTTLTEEDGESTYHIKVNGKELGVFQNPETSADMKAYSHTVEKVFLERGDLIQIESNTHSNGKIPEGEAFAFARGRWRSITFSRTNSASNIKEEKDRLLIFEAEHMELKGQWKLAKDSSKASGGEYIYFDGPNSYHEVNMNDHISYTFRINDPGNYTLKWMMRQPEGERGTDKGNDAYLYLSDDVAFAKIQKMTAYEKFYSRSGDDFVLHGVAEVHGLGHSWLTAKFPTAGEYTLNIVGRSHGLQIDRIILYKGMNIEEVQSILEKVSNL
ncbi:MAG: hypothetical protein AAF696_18755 [Bacteroidota bacterium]